MKVDITDNIDDVLERFDGAVYNALEECGLIAENYAKRLCPVAKEYGGTLRNSITHTVDIEELAAYVGTVQDYAIYVEMGTGIYASEGGGRPTPWHYQDAHGQWHTTRGNRAQPFIKPAVADHVQTYKSIIDKNFKNA
jgi:HK97 gp10 family phage protein